MVVESMMFSSTWQVLENYRDSVYVTNDMAGYDPLDTPEVPKLPPQHQVPQRLPTSKYAVKPGSKNYVFTPDTASPTSDRSRSPNSLSSSPSGSSTSTFSDVSSNRSMKRKEELRRRRTPSGSEPKVRDLRLTRSNGSTQLDSKDLPRYKYLARYDSETEAAPEQKPMIPRKNPLRNSLQKKPLAGQSQRYDDDANTTSLGERRNKTKLEQVVPPARRSPIPLKLDIPPEDLAPPPRLDNPYQRPSQNSPAQGLRKPANTKASLKKPSDQRIGLPPRPNTGKRLPALPKEFEASEDMPSRQPRSAHAHGKSSTAMNLVGQMSSSIIQETQRDQYLQKPTGQSLANMMSEFRSPSMYNDSLAPNSTSRAPSSSRVPSKSKHMRGSMSVDSFRPSDPNTPLSGAENLVSKYNPQRVLSPTSAGPQPRSSDAGTPLRFPSFQQRGFESRKASDGEVSPRSFPQTRKVPEEEISPRSFPKKESRKPSYETELSPLSKPVQFQNSWAAESPKSLARKAVPAYAQDSKDPTLFSQEEPDEPYEQRIQSIPPPPPPKKMLPSNPRPTKNERPFAPAAPQATSQQPRADFAREAPLPQDDMSRGRKPLPRALATPLRPDRPAAERKYEVSPQRLPQPPAPPRGPGIGLPSGPRGKFGGPVRPPLLETNLGPLPHSNALDPPSITPPDRDNPLDDEELELPKPRFAAVDSPRSATSATSDYEHWTPGPPSPSDDGVGPNLDPADLNEAVFPPRSSSQKTKPLSVASSSGLPSPRPSSSISNTMPNAGPYQRFNPYNNTLTPPPEASNLDLSLPSGRPKPSPARELTPEPDEAPLSPLLGPELSVLNFTCSIAHRQLIPSTNSEPSVRCQTCAVNARTLHRCTTCSLNICGRCKSRLGSTRGNLGEVVNLASGEKQSNLARKDQIDVETAANLNNGYASNNYGNDSYGSNDFDGGRPPFPNTNLNAPSPRGRSGTNESGRSGFSNTSGEIRVAMPPMPPYAQGPPRTNSPGPYGGLNQNPPRMGISGPMSAGRPPPRGPTGPNGPNSFGPPGPNSRPPPNGMLPPPRPGFQSSMSSPRGRGPPAPWMSGPNGPPSTSGRSGSPGPGFRPPPGPGMMNGPGNMSSPGRAPWMNGPNGPPSASGRAGSPGPYGRMGPGPMNGMNGMNGGRAGGMSERAMDLGMGGGPGGMPQPGLNPQQMGPPRNGPGPGNFGAGNFGAGNFGGPGNFNGPNGFGGGNGFGPGPSQMGNRPRRGPMPNDDEGLDLDDIGAMGLYSELGGGGFGVMRKNPLPNQAFQQPKIGVGKGGKSSIQNGRGGGDGRTSAMSNRSGERMGRVGYGGSGMNGMNGPMNGQMNGGYGGPMGGNGGYGGMNGGMRGMPAGLPGDGGLMRGAGGMDAGMGAAMRAGGM